MGPKKHVNEKAEAAKARKEGAKTEKASKAAKDAEDREWAAAGEGAKSKAQAKKAEQEKQRLEAAAKKAEVKRLAEEEEAALSKPKAAGKAPRVQGPNKVTAYQIEQQKQADHIARHSASKEKEMAARREVSEGKYAALVERENVNRQEDVVEATSVEQAVHALASVGISTPTPEDKHPEKRMRAAWLAFEEHNLPLLKMEKPGLKQSQYRDLLWTKWQRSPDNPINQAKAAAK